MSADSTLPNPANLAFVEALYADFLRDPASVSDGWRQYFQSGSSGDPFSASPRLGPSFPRTSLFNPSGNGNGAGLGSDLAHEASVSGLDVAEFAALQDRVDQLIRAYRVRGHLIAKFDPLGLPRHDHPELNPSYYGLTGAHMSTRFSSRTITGSADTMTLDAILEHLRETYCRYIGAQFMHIDDIAIKMWLQNRMEGTKNRIVLERDEQLRVLSELTDAVMFEDFIQKKYLGAKRFSLEGAESLIPLLDLAIERGAEQGLREVVIGMAHRGRLNVLANIIGKSARQIFWEFEDAYPELYLGGGDVKYHLGYSGDRVTSSGDTVHLSLCFNPSHLEFVNPVALGRTRAKQDRRQDDIRHEAMCILIHGDAAFVGQGVVQESLNLSELDGYTTGGALHVIVNNQIGFTTSSGEGRSSLYASSVARMLQIPIFHVNGEDPEAVAHVVKMAMDFRRTFQRDVVIDMYCFRKYGHNEGDEPAFTHPVMYAKIRQKKSVMESYRDRVLKLGELTREEADEIADKRREALEQELNVARGQDYAASPDTLGGVWQGYVGGPEDGLPEPGTGVDRERLAELLRKLTQVPEGFRPHPKVTRLLAQRREMAEGSRALDWAAAEALALGTIATEGHPVRFSGQDSGRGTFSHRHAILHDCENGRAHCPLQVLEPGQAPVEIVNSPLSEVGVLGFEYGYSLDRPEGLVMWEAQFGDFCNVAQPIIDQFIVSAEDKWVRLSGLVLLLPHGYEGQGPEHSSARLERFLTLAAEDNIQVANPTTPAQYYHLLRRQVLRPWRKPLVVMTPKSLLRNPLSTSSLDELASGRFRRVISPDMERSAVRRVLLTSGKLYFELETERRKRERHDVAIIRVEQLYPLPESVLAEALDGIPEGTPAFWVQEEPENTGAWRTLRVGLGERLLNRYPFSGIYRDASASPATGSGASHRMEQEEIVCRAFEEEMSPAAPAARST